MRVLVTALAIALFVLHQDFWFWNDERLVLGVMPTGLAYHALYSIAAAALWAFTMRVAWPQEIVDFAELNPEPPTKTAPKSGDSPA